MPPSERNTGRSTASALDSSALIAIRVRSTIALILRRLGNQAPSPLMPAAGQGPDRCRMIGQEKNGVQRLIGDFADNDNRIGSRNQHPTSVIAASAMRLYCSTTALASPGLGSSAKSENILRDGAGAPICRVITLRHRGGACLPVPHGEACAGVESALPGDLLPIRAASASPQWFGRPAARLAGRCVPDAARSHGIV
jgi:hypothetical protein